MSWVEVSPRNWQRPLGENEALLKYIGDRSNHTGHEQWSINAIGTFRLSKIDGVPEHDDLALRLRKAWIFLRHKHPGIASTAGADTVNYVVPDIETLEEWTNNTFHTISNASVSSDDLVASIKPSPYVQGYFLSHTGQFLLHTSHWRTDGFGVLQLLDAFFDALASDPDPETLPWGDEPVRLAPSIEEVLQLPRSPTDEIMAAASHCLASGRHVVGSIGLPFQEGIPGDTRGIRRRLSESTTSSLLKACETNNLKPLSAVHASLAAANFSGSKVVDGHYTSNMRFSLRPYLREPFNSASYAAGLYTGSYMAKVDHGMSWQNIAAQYNKLYDAGLSHEFLIARRQFAIQALNMMQGSGLGGRAPLVRSEIDISSVGNAENLVSPYHRGRGGCQLDLEVKEISLGIECLAEESYLFVWTFRGKMVFNLVYNEAFYTADFMEKIMDIVEGTLLSELQVEK